MHLMTLTEAFSHRYAPSLWHQKCEALFDARGTSEDQVYANGAPIDWQRYEAQ